MQVETVAGISYSKPTVTLLNHSGIGVAEYAARTCYDSFEATENLEVRAANYYFKLKDQIESESSVVKKSLNGIEHSDLLDSLAWTHFHHSILEHATLSYLIRGTSRCVLQEHARHRIQSISVRSTRYTMSDVINAFIAYPIDRFICKLLELDLFVTDADYSTIEARVIYEKLNYQLCQIGRDEFMELALSRSGIEALRSYDCNDQDQDELFEALQNSKKKRNIGDNFKHIVTDNWKVDMVVSFNLRSLKNYFTLRDSGAAYFQIRWLAEEMKKATPRKYLDLIVKT